MNSYLRSIGGLTMVCGLMACPVTAHATTFNYVLVSSDHHLNTINHETMDGTAATLSRQTDAVIPVNFGNGGWFSRDGSMDVFAEASVAEGLKTRASVTLGAFEQTRPAFALPSLMSFSTAMTGDSIMASNSDNTAYQWAASDEVTLKLKISGSSSHSSHLVNTPDDSMPDGVSPYSTETFLTVLAFESGYVESIGAAVDVADALFFKQWHLGEYVISAGYAQPQDHIVLDEHGQANLDITFMPGQDFDLVFMLISRVAVNHSFDSGSVTQDFSNTVTFSLLGPQGAQMSSSSGDFDFGTTATDAIPEPVSASLLAMGGVMLLGAMGRRRR